MNDIYAKAALTALAFVTVQSGIMLGVLRLMKVKVRVWEVLLAIGAGSILTLIPVVGGVAMLLGEVVVLWWRLGRSHIKPILLSVVLTFLASLVMGWLFVVLVVH